MEYGHAYLQATRQALEQHSVEVGGAAARREVTQASLGLGADTEPSASSSEAITLQERYRHLLDKYTRLQQNFTEQLRAEEQSNVATQLRERYERTHHLLIELRARHKDLVSRHKGLKERHQKQKKQNKVLQGELQREREEQHQLLHLIEELSTFT